MLVEQQLQHPTLIDGSTIALTTWALAHLNYKHPTYFVAGAAMQVRRKFPLTARENAMMAWCGWTLFVVWRQHQHMIFVTAFFVVFKKSVHIDHTRRVSNETQSFNVIPKLSY